MIFLIILPLVLGMIGCTRNQKQKSGRWKIIRRADWETRFYDVFFIDEKTGWAVGNNEGNTIEEEFDSVIAYTVDGGETWKPQASETQHPLRSVMFVDHRSGWIAGDNGVILHTSDGGGTWYKQASNTFNNLFDLHFFSAREGWAVGDFGTALYTQNGGETWENRAQGLGDSSLRGLHFLDPRYGWTVSYEGLTYRTNDGGKTWHYQDTGVRYRLSDVVFCQSQ